MFSFADDDGLGSGGAAVLNAERVTAGGGLSTLHRRLAAECRHSGPSAGQEGLVVGAGYPSAREQQG